MMRIFYMMEKTVFMRITSRAHSAVSQRAELTRDARLVEKEWLCFRCFDKQCEVCAACHKTIDGENEC
ncbi:unnamed protein product, partial [Cylicostephanus goldi]